MLSILISFIAVWYNSMKQSNDQISFIKSFRHHITKPNKYVTGIISIPFKLCLICGIIFYGKYYLLYNRSIITILTFICILIVLFLIIINELNPLLIAFENDIFRFFRFNAFNKNNPNQQYYEDKYKYFAEYRAYNQAKSIAQLFHGQCFAHSIIHGNNPCKLSLLHCGQIVCSKRIKEQEEMYGLHHMKNQNDIQYHNQLYQYQYRFPTKNDPKYLSYGYIKNQELNNNIHIPNCITDIVTDFIDDYPHYPQLVSHQWSQCPSCDLLYNKYIEKFDYDFNKHRLILNENKPKWYLWNKNTV